MLHNTKDNQQENFKLSDIIINKPIHRVGFFMCLFLFLLSGASMPFLYENEITWIVLFPLSSIVIISLVAWFTNNMRKEIKNIYYYAQLSKDNEKTLHQLVYYDSLTGLPNRKFILEEVSSMIDGEDKTFFLIYIDMDDFKRINETAGYSVGDEILSTVSGRWSSLIKGKDVIGHLGGDEFALLIRDDMDRNRVMEHMEEFRSILDKPIDLYGKEYYISASFGIAQYPNDGRDGIELLKNSFIAMNKAKTAGKNYIQFYTYEMQLEISKRLQIENGLLYSIRNNELYMVYQPIYHCESRMLRGFEALIRWDYPGIGPISPSQFIPVAEETGIIVNIGKWIIKQVLTKFIEFQSVYNIKTVVSINISIVQMLEPNFVSMIEEVLDETGYDGRYLELEITESVLIAYPDYIIEIIAQLKALGIGIALDDFGTGYASIKHLQMLPINILKIDKSFIDKINKVNSMNQIIGYIINLAHQLGIEVIAEGVEHEEQLNFLGRIGCDYIQGFLLGKPLKEEYLSKKLLTYSD